MKVPLTSRHIFVLSLILLTLTGVGIRRMVLNAQYATIGEEIPFTLESALQYRLTRTVYESGSLPEVDEDVEVPKGVETRRVYSVGAEYVYAALARCFPSSMSLEKRLRWVQVLWFCLGIPLIGLWIRWLSGSRFAGVIAAAFYAVSLSAVMRSTGQELSRENFALPLLIGHLAFDAFSTKRARYSLLAGVLSAALLMLAAMTWDLIQFYVILWGAFAFGSVALRGVAGWGHEKLNWTIQWGGLVLASVLNPYMRAHHWLFSPGMLLAHGVVLIGLVKSRSPGSRGRRILIMLIPLAIGLLIGIWGYGRTYGHFFSLIAAKARFLNQKPADPAMLNFAQRIMWVPGLNSSSWGLAWTLFPSMLVLTSIGAVVLCVQHKAHPRVRLIQQLVFFGTSLIGFCFFVRFHVFLVIFAIGLIGWWLAEALKSRWWQKVLVITLVGLGLLVEAGRVIEAPQRWGRPGVYYKELQELTDWTRSENVQSPVLGNFAVSSSLLAYGGCPIVLHPKFESKGIRDRVEAYGEALFKGNEREFRDWADEFGVRYYVHSLGELSPYRPERQMRYMVDALDPPDHAAVRLFEQRPQEGRYFIYLWGNAKYRVFQMLSRDEEQLAGEMSDSARDALQHGDLLKAGQLARMALTHDPLNREALTTIGHVDSLRAKSFEYDALKEPEDE